MSSFASRPLALFASEPFRLSTSERALTLVWILVLGLPSCLGRAPRPPLAERRHHLVRSPQGNRIDPYYWLRDDAREDPGVLSYLRAENAYLRQWLKPEAERQEELYRELTGRLVPDLESLPTPRGEYVYWWKYLPGEEYPRYLRRHQSPEAPEELLLDLAALAKGSEYFALGGIELSPSGTHLGFSADFTGRRQYRLATLALETGELRWGPEGSTGGLAWTPDSKGMIWIERDPTTLLGSKVRRWDLDRGNSLLYEEEDRSFYLSVATTRDQEEVTLHLRSTERDELRILEGGSFRVLVPRTLGARLDADHAPGEWIVRTNWQAPDFQIVSLREGEGDRPEAWRSVIPPVPGRTLDHFRLFGDWVVLTSRSRGATQIRQVHRRTYESRTLLEPDPTLAAGLRLNPDPTQGKVRLWVSSLASPEEIWECDLSTGATEVLKVEEVGGGFDSMAYQTARIWVPARDGESIPVTLVHRRDTPLDGTAPWVLYGYGAYGTTVFPRFRSSILSLLDRGFVWAIAHVRGGQMLGRRWYEGGRLEAKPHSFRDFVDAAEGLIAKDLVHPRAGVALGGSAGGLLVGGAMNLRPDLFRAVVAHVPFVDVVTTMLDESIPLTTNEYREWGDPRQAQAYRTMLSYSPYDNVRAKTQYPSLLVTTGLWDSQVQYFEPAKWVARMRHRTGSRRPILLSTNFQAGHGGASGRSRRFHEVALEYAFVLHELEAELGRKLPRVASSPVPESLQ